MTEPARTIVVTRGEQVESRHEVHGVAVDATGRVLDEFGDIHQQVYPRSALKPFQALPLLTSGAADRYALDDTALALAAASHNAEPYHVERVTAWLHDLNLDVNDLRCGAEPPLYPPAAYALARAHQQTTPAHNNCSGKHTAMLTISRHLDAPIGSYLDPQHPVQTAIVEQLRESFHLEHLGAPARDGCGAPIWQVPLSVLARGVAELDRDAAGRRVCDAMTAHPFLVAGTDRECTLSMTARPDIMVKNGAEGVFVALLRGQDIGIAIKVSDGAERASGVALVAALDRLGASRSGDGLDPLRTKPVLNSLGAEVGSITPGNGWQA
jgi:L-asparaginase II